jgi:hypothetical protein
MTIDIIVDDNGLAEKYRRISRQMPGEVKELMHQSVLYVQSQIPGYPAEPPGSHYRRTGTLGRVLTAAPGSGAVGVGSRMGQPLTRIETLGGNVKGVIGGRLEYIGGVVNEGTQARVHRGRWWTLQKVLRDSREGIEKIFRTGVLKLFK